MLSFFGRTWWLWWLLAIGLTLRLHCIIVAGFSVMRTMWGNPRARGRDGRSPPDCRSANT
jgi:hypothetical protein